MYEYMYVWEQQFVSLYASMQRTGKFINSQMQGSKYSGIRNK